MKLKKEYFEDCFNELNTNEEFLITSSILKDFLFKTNSCLTHRGKKPLENKYPILYFLIHNEPHYNYPENLIITYIGQSQNIDRIHQHKNKIWTHYAYLEINPSVLNELEAQHILINQPIHNKTIPQNSRFFILKNILYKGNFSQIWNYNEIIKYLICYFKKPISDFVLTFIDNYLFYKFKNQIYIDKINFGELVNWDFECFPIFEYNHNHKFYKMLYDEEEINNWI